MFLHVMRLAGLKPILIAFLIFHCYIEAMFLTDNDAKILTDVTRHMNIRNLVFTRDRTAFKALPIIKNLSTFVTFKTRKDLFVYLLLQNYNEKFLRREMIKTMILYTSDDDIIDIDQMFYFFREGNGLHLMSKFAWMLLLNSTKMYHFNSAIPYDCEFLIARPLDSSSTYEITKVYNLGSNRIVKNYGTWNVITGLNLTKKYEKIDMNQTAFKAAAVICTEPQPRRLITADESNNYCTREDFFKNILRSMNFKYLEADDGTIDHDIDAIVDTLYMQESKEVRSFNIIKHWLRTRLVFFIKYSDAANNLADYYVRPFTIHLWITVILTVIFGGFLFSALNHTEASLMKNKTCNFLDHFFMPLWSLCSQGEELGKNIKSRLCLMTYRLLAIVIIQWYCADLTSYLSLRIVKFPFRNLDEFVQAGNYKLLLLQNTLSNAYIRNRIDPVANRIKNEMAEYISDPPEVPKKLCSSNEKFASLHFHNVKITNITCRLIKIPQPVVNLLPTTLMTNENHYARIINSVFLKARESGLIQKIYKDLYPSYSKYQHEEEDLQSVEINQLFQIFSLLGLGLYISLMFLLGEMAITC